MERQFPVFMHIMMTNNVDTYGRLYTWDALMNGSSSSSTNPSGVQGVCPTDWHVPSHAEWAELIDYLGGTSVAGGKMKETGTVYWNSPNAGATNESGFTALPGGYRRANGSYDFLGEYAYFSSATQFNLPQAWYRILEYTSTEVYFHHSENKPSGFSVRCVQD